MTAETVVILVLMALCLGLLAGYYLFDEAHRMHDRVWDETDERRALSAAFNREGL
jgi:hypothetical protein